MKNTTKVVLLALTLALLVQGPVRADPLSEQLQKQRNQLEQDKNALKSAEDKREELEAKVEYFDNEIIGLMNNIEENKKQIAQNEKGIKEAQEEIVKAEENVKAQEELLNKRMRGLYMNGQASYLKVLLQAKDFSDLLYRLEMVVKIIDFDKKVISDLEIKKTGVANKKFALEEQQDDLLSLKTENENKLINLNSNIETQKKVIDGIKLQESQFASKVNTSQAIVNATLAQINSIRKAAPKYEVSRGAAPITNDNIIAYASNFLGTPYRWGGTKPSTGFDCSGFTQYVYAHFGINLGRSTYDQINDGYAVTKDQLQPGDLVFFGSWNNPNHMGIYAGNNTYIHSPRTGDVVKISPMTRTDYITARRVK